MTRRCAANDDSTRDLGRALLFTSSSLCIAAALAVGAAGCAADGDAFAGGDDVTTATAGDASPDGGLDDVADEDALAVGSAELTARHPFDLVSDPPAPIGAGRLIGTIVFHSRRRFSYSGSVNDICPADGHDAQAILLVHRHGDSLERWEWIAKDNRGCSASARSFSGNLRYGRRVAWVKPMLCLLDNSTGLPADCVTGSRKRNPF